MTDIAQRPHPGDDPPRGLILFPPGKTARHRRRRKIFAAIQILVAAMLVWPLYARFSGIEPRVLGLPLSFAWVILALLIGFAALLWLYLGEEDHPGVEAQPPGEER